jgi:hypothetical protein
MQRLWKHQRVQLIAVAEFDLGAMLVSHLDGWWLGYRTKLDGLTDQEHLWAPKPGWTVRETQGAWLIDSGDREADPAPFTSIAWRMWHISADCLDSYSRRAFGQQSGPDDMVWVGTAAEALHRTDAAWACFRDNIAALDDATLRQPIGDEFGGFSASPHAALALHAHAEVTHHGAEVALLRDLYRLR